MALTKPHLSIKHINIKKDNTVIFASIAVAVFLVVFGLVAGKSLLSQSLYNQRVIDAKKGALKQAVDNTKNVKNLEQSYLSFAKEPINILGGNPVGEGPIDGSNPKLVLDALPSVYDYPALSSSIEKILLDNGYQIERIGGSEDEKLSGTNPVNSSSSKKTTKVTVNAKSEATQIPYPLTVVSSVDDTQKLLDILERSIRPFYIETVSFSGSDLSLTTKISMTTFYQPGMKFQAGSKVVD